MLECAKTELSKILLRWAQGCKGFEKGGVVNEPGGETGSPIGRGSLLRATQAVESIVLSLLCYFLGGLPLPFTWTIAWAGALCACPSDTRNSKTYLPVFDGVKQGVAVSGS